MNRRRAVLACLVLAAAGSSARLRAGVRVEGSSLGGPGGYAERSVGAVVSVKPPIEWDDPDTPWPFTAVTLHARRTGYDRDGSSGPTYETELGVGLDLFQRSHAVVSYVITPALSDDVGAYRARGWDITVAAGWEGWLPALDVDDRRPAFPVETRLTFRLARLNHEERLAPSTSTVRWSALRENVLGLVLEETLWGVTTLRAAGEGRTYDLDVRDLSRRSEFFALRNTRASAPPELLEGFVRRSWGAGLDQRFGKRLELSGDWRRSSYEAGAVPRADTYVGRGTVYWGLHFSTYARYEVFQPVGLPRAEYKGAGLGMRF